AQPTAVAKPAIRTSPWRVRCFGNEGRMSPRGVGLGGMGKGVRRPVLFRGRLRCECNEHSALNGQTSSLFHRYVELCTCVVRSIANGSSLVLNRPWRWRLNGSESEWL